METKFNSVKIRMVIGLGNPDKEYENTYHNVGFLFTDYLTKNLPISNFQFLISKPVKSNTSMNLSGAFVSKVLRKHGVKPEEFILVHDDSDLGLGTYKIGFGRGSAGHKGVESVIKALRTKNFWRLRIGIRPISPISRRRKKAEEFVLNKISAMNKKTLEAAFEEISRRLASI